MKLVVGSLCVCVALVGSALAQIATPQTVERVTFFASHPTATSPGHVWVGFPDRDGVAYGFYPDGVRDDSDRESDISYTFSGPSMKVDLALEVIEEYRTQDYRLLRHNCRNLVREVALALGLEAPELRPRDRRSPAAYLSDLVDENPTARFR